MHKKVKPFVYYVRGMNSNLVAYMYHGNYCLLDTQKDVFLREEVLPPCPNQGNCCIWTSTFSSTPFVASPVGDSVSSIGQSDAAIMTIFTIGHIY